MNSYRVPLFRELRTALEEQGITLEVFVGQPTGPDLERGDSHRLGWEVELRQWSVVVGGNTVIFRLLPRKLYCVDLLILEQAVRNLESYPILLTRTLLGRRTAQWGHGSTITKPQGRWARLAQAWMMRRSSWFFAYTVGSLRRGMAIGAGETSSTVLHNSFDVSELLQWRAVTHPSSGRAEINTLFVDRTRWNALYVGGLDSSKRVAMMIDVARESYQIDPRFRLIVAGDGADADLIRQVDGAPWLTYVGPVTTEEKADLGALASVVLVTGRVGLIAIDSFALGVPIVTAAWEHHAPEFEYLNVDNSLITAGEDPRVELTTALAHLMSDTEELARLSDGAHATAEQFSNQRTVDEFVSGILSALAGRS